AKVVRGVAAELLADEDIRAPAVVCSWHEDRLLSDLHAVVEARDPRFRVGLELRVPVPRVLRVYALKMLLLLRCHLADVVIEGAIVLEQNVHVAVGPDIRVVAVGALQEDLHVLHRVRRRAIQQVGADGLITIGELSGLPLLRPRLELPLRYGHRSLLRARTHATAAPARALNPARGCRSG